MTGTRRTPHRHAEREVVQGRNACIDPEPPGPATCPLGSRVSPSRRLPARPWKREGAGIQIGRDRLTVSFIGKHTRYTKLTKRGRKRSQDPRQSHGPCDQRTNSPGLTSRGLRYKTLELLTVRARAASRGWAFMDFRRAVSRGWRFRYISRAVSRGWLTRYPDRAFSRRFQYCSPPESCPAISLFLGFGDLRIHCPAFPTCRGSATNAERETRLPASPFPSTSCSRGSGLDHIVTPLILK